MPIGIPHELNVLLIPEGFADGHVEYTAQCLEYDMATQGKNIRDAVYELYRAVTSTFVLVEQGEVAVEDLAKAPGEYWQRFDEAFELTPTVRLDLDALQ